MIELGIHAREWISPAFVTWLIHELVENYAAHPQYVDNIDWYIKKESQKEILTQYNLIILLYIYRYIMPVINPDGYRFTHASGGV